MASFNDEYKAHEIERGILQQLLYSRKKKELPNSKIERTNKTSKPMAVLIASLTTVLLVSIILFGLQVSGHEIIKYTYINYILLGLIALSFFILLYSIIYYHKLKKIQYKDLEANFDYEDDNKVEDTNLINKFVDEVLYFFECTKINVVIFEDLDRFANLQIFSKLRELNTIINKSVKKEDKVTFIYAVKDDLLKTKELRAKFFEFILPIAPIINPLTVYKQIKKLMQPLINFDINFNLTDKFIKGISIYIPDMRILKNTINDYIIMYSKNKKNQENKSLNAENLFALCLYKNLFPTDYSLLEKNEGIIPRIIDIKKLRSILKKEYLSRIDCLKKELDKCDDEILKNFEELKYLFKGQAINLSSGNYGNNLTKIEDIKTFHGLDYSHIEHPVQKNYSIREHLTLTPNGDKYEDREDYILAITENKKHVIYDEITELEDSINLINNYTLKQIIAEIGVDNCILDVEKEYLEDEEKKSLLNAELTYIKFLINNDYIDENYLDYISHYNALILTSSDNQFVKEVRNGQLNYDSKLKKFDNVVRYLTDEDFSRTSILTKEIIDRLDDIKGISVQENDNKYNNLLHTLNYSLDSNVLGFISRYFNNIVNCSDYKNKIQVFLKRKTFLKEIINNKSLSLDDQVLVVSEFLLNISEYADYNIDNCLVDLLNEKGIIYKIYHNMNNNLQKISDIIEKLPIKVKVVIAREEYKSINEIICDNDAYIITTENLYAIICDNQNENEFKSSNFTYIKDSKNNIFNYIVANILVYVKNVILDKNITLTNEDKQNINYLVNNDNIPMEYKSGIIKKYNRAFVVDLKSVDTKLYELLFDNNGIDARWSNIFYSYNIMGYRSIKHYIEEDININDDIDWDTLDHNIKYKFFDDVLTNCHGTSLENIINKIGCTFELRYIKDISQTMEDNIITCINNNKICFYVQDFSLIFNKQKILNAYLKIFEKEIFEKFETFFAIPIGESYNSRGYTFEQMKQYYPNLQLEISNVLACEGINENIKQNILQRCQYSIYINGYDNIYANIIIDENCNISQNVLWQFINSDIDIDKKKMILWKCKDLIQTNDYNNNLKNYLLSLGPKWKDLIIDNKNISIEKTEANEKVLDCLNEKGILKVHKKRNVENMLSVKIIKNLNE